MKKVKKLILLLALLTMVAGLGGLAIACSGGFEKNKEYILKDVTFSGNWAEEAKDQVKKMIGNQKIKFDDTKVYSSYKTGDTWGDWDEGGTYTISGDKITSDGKEVATIKGKQILMIPTGEDGLLMTLIYER